MGRQLDDGLCGSYEADKCQHLRASLIFPELKEVVRGFGADYNPDGTIFDSNTR